MSITSKRPKNLSLHKMIPNMITLTALATGMTAVKFAIAERWEAAVIAIVIAAFMDAFDGAAARLLKAQSALGAELDSFSDFVCFGVAPAIVLYLWILNDWPRWGWAVALVFAMAVALRLARFNIATVEKEAGDPLALYFTGVPSPAGAGLAIAPMFLSFQNPEIYNMLLGMPWVVAGWTLLVAIMMVSNIPTFSSKQFRIPYALRVPFLGLFALLLAGLINETWPTLTLMLGAYLLLLPLASIHYAQTKARLARGQTLPEDTDMDHED